MIITEDGITKLKTSHNISAFLVSGSLGGGTATFGYLTSDGSFESFSDSDGVAVAVEIGKQYEARHGLHQPVYINLTGSTTPALEVIEKRIL